MDSSEPHVAPKTGAEALLLGLKASGIDYIFANAGTDFPPIIEAMATLPKDAVPVPVTVPHETAGVAMAHGFYLVTGRAQSVMVHVNVGLANSVMGVINAASDDIPVLVMSGRTPITEVGRPGHRVTPIHYGQEMFDQSSLLRDVVKYSYELRYAEQAGEVVGRAMALATSAPQGPVYLSLPREPLAEACPDWTPTQTVRPAATPSAPAPEALALLADWLKAAQRPVVLCQRGDPEGLLSKTLLDFAARHGVAIVSPFMTRNVMPSGHPNFAGYAPDAVFDGTDLLIVLDSAVPWIAASTAPGPDTRIAHIGPDPHFARMPMRGFQTDLAVQSDPVLAIKALDTALGNPLPAAAARTAYLSDASANRRAKLTAIATQKATGPMGAEWLSHSISAVMGEDAVVFSDLGVLPGFMDLAGPNRVFISPHSGGLGWAMNAALGAQLADRERLVIACVGDGSYMFANPVAAHQIAEAMDLRILTIVKNNATWNAVRRSVLASYPDGAAARANEMPLTSLSPLPDFIKVAEASRAFAEKVDRADDLPAALARAINAIRTERRQALLDVRVAVSDAH
jgi:acetolactate synthase-1/2/3 large subunit